MSRLILVRHAMPALDARIASAQWQLSPEGESAARALRGLLPTDADVVSSPETKAAQTVSLATGSASIVTDARFAEVCRPGEPFDADVRARRLAWIERRPDERHTGWETSAEAAARFEDGVRAHATGERPLVIGTHGMVLTAWLLSRGIVDPAEAGAYWSNLAFPDVVTVDCG
ncbi:histidine phosphatase family protein [Calidifontibacter sp. DB0510]|uniref:Histidine phosphatase family protein n=1 Tax=Metallococcus carri TaxID=1656884 RepID=A0A967ED69_9MICO|nr:histidine phosphatase family protein [Metallococcus carri]NHN54421.1 histidine phosphatase family protein [Metallococcus carri]NOP36740.1 histidine phosphatase family protein [Calidifontibacter sp. DB2511S]